MRLSKWKRPVMAPLFTSISRRDALSRRDFLKLSALSFGSLAFHPLRAMLPPEDRVEKIGVARVTISKIGVFQQPSLDSDRLWSRQRDELVGIFEEILSPYGPSLNPHWYKVVGGYCHSAYLQRVETAHLNSPLKAIAKGGQLAEVTVPYTQSMRFTAHEGWTPLYRLYFQSVHWVTGVDPGPDEKPWYRLTDELLHIDYHVPATHLRPVTSQELTPISPEVPPGEKRIEVSLLDQTLTAYENEKVVLHTFVSSGLPNLSGIQSEIPTVTPRGNFTIDLKMPSKHMGDGQLTDEINAYERPGVPWVCFFDPTGIAFHGTYWHNNFGSRMSHGCVNMHMEDAKWLYRWSTPVAEPHDWERKGYGTRVTVY